MKKCKVFTEFFCFLNLIIVLDLTLNSFQWKYTCHSLRVFKEQKNMIDNKHMLSINNINEVIIYIFTPNRFFSISTFNPL